MDGWWQGDRRGRLSPGPEQWCAVFLCLSFFQETEQKRKKQTLVTFSQVLRNGPHDSDWATFTPVVIRKTRESK